jgi:hypothetical protein
LFETTPTLGHGALLSVAGGGSAIGILFTDKSQDSFCDGD